MIMQIDWDEAPSGAAGDTPCGSATTISEAIQAASGNIHRNVCMDANKAEAGLGQRPIIMFAFGAEQPDPCQAGY
jgi:hypothetical protein